MTVAIPLTQGKVAIIDDEDYAEIGLHKWYFKQGYAMRTRSLRMARVIMDAPADKMVDHINGDTLDNRRANLRICTHAENNRNRRAHMLSKSSKYKGISLHPCGKWQVNVSLQNTSHYIGLFKDELEAAQAYDAAARIHHGEFARTNF